MCQNYIYFLPKKEDAMNNTFTKSRANQFSSCRSRILILSLILVIYFSSYSLSQTLWNEDWEGNWTIGWHVDNGTWEVGTPTSGPDSAFDGQNCAATVLNGEYSEPVDTRLIRHTSFIVPQSTDNPRLRFWYWFSFGDGDWGEVQIKTNGGGWEAVSSLMENYGSNAWSYGLVDLSDFAGDTVQIGFYFHSEPIVYYGDVSTGWYIDDVSLVTGPYVFNNPEGFESGFGDWSVDKGTWEIGIPTSGPENAHGGQSCTGTNLEGNYQEPSDSRLISPPFVVPSSSENPRFRFWYWFNFAEDDWGTVQIKIKGGEWDSISNIIYNLGSNAWSYGLVDLSTYSGDTVQIGFYFHSEPHYYYGDVSTGWYIDDVALVTGPYVFNNPEGFEEGFEDWWVNEGTWEVGTPMSGPDSSYNGQNCAGTNLEGDYEEPADSRLISPPFIIPNSLENPSIQFWHWFNFAEDDWSEIEISTDSGVTWEPISNQFTNTSGGSWTPFYISLSAYSDNEAQIAFTFHSYPHFYYGDVSSGWYIDDVKITPYIVGVKNNFENKIPTHFQISQNYPNPFNPTTKIKFEIPKSSFVTLKVYDILGREVAKLVNQGKSAGSYEINFDASELTSGIYFYRIQAGNFAQTRKMMLLK